MDTVGSHLCISGQAKRARPLLCLYFHWLFEDSVKEDYVDLAVTAEFIHAASLLHDDVVDEARMRRGKISANALFGNTKAVLGGDYLLSEAFSLLRPFDRDFLDKAIDVVRQMTIAALIEVDARGRMGLSESGWNDMARGKTGVLFSWCGYAAGAFVKKSKDKELLWSLGEHIGLIFQMVDDLKDFSGDRLLKDPCSDIRNKEPSLPVILAAQSSSSINDRFEQYYALEELSDDQVEHLHSLVLKSGVVPKIEERMHELKAPDYFHACTF